MKTFFGSASELPLGSMIALPDGRAFVQIMRVATREEAVAWGRARNGERYTPPPGEIRHFYECQIVEMPLIKRPWHGGRWN